MSNQGGFKRFTKANRCLNELINTLDNDDLNEKQSQIDYRNAIYNHNQYHCLAPQKIQKILRKTMKQRKELMNATKTIKKLSKIISNFVCSSRYVFYQCISRRCDVSIKIHHQEKVIYYGISLFDEDDYNSDTDSYTRFMEEQIPGFNDPDNDEYEIVFRSQKQTNVIAYFFNFLPSNNSVSWLGVSGEGSIGRFNIMNYNRMTKFNQILINYGYNNLTNHLSSVSGPVCSPRCFADTIFSVENAFGTMNTFMVQEYLKHKMTKEFINLPFVPFVIIQLIASYVSLP